MKPHELHSMPAALLRRIVLMEARAKPRLKNVDGLWRKPVLGKRGATPRPGSMTEYIREQALLPAQVIESITAVAPQSLVRWQQAMGQLAQRPDLKEWLQLFDAAAADGMRVSPTPDLCAS